MGKIKKRHSLKWSFVKYIPLCLLMSWIGVYAIGIGTNNLQDWYKERHWEIELWPSMENIKFFYDENGNLVYQLADVSRGQIPAVNFKYQVVYWLIGNGQLLWMVLWVFLCIGIAGTYYYNRELKKPITMLMDASQKISENNLDFHIEYQRDNELGLLCGSFEEMRQELDKNNRKMWSLLEERKSLNRAFSHDLRTPLTVLKGYTDFLNKYIPDGKISEEKLLEVLSMINGQIERLENYTEKMNSVQKLSEIVPDKKRISTQMLLKSLQRNGEMLCDGLEFVFQETIAEEEMFLDEQLVLEVYENLLSNAVRFAAKQVKVTVLSQNQELRIVTEDDGNGFSQEGLRCAANPFYRGERQNDKCHFGLGLYICRVLCEQCGGRLVVENGITGGKVTAIFPQS